MRTIKFRGKQKNTEEWLFGNLIYLTIKGEQSPFITQIKHKGDKLEEINYIQVIPSSVGQFTGLQDSNGKDIYEGDVVEFTRHNLKIEGRPTTTLVHTCVVSYNEERRAFWMRYSFGLGRGAASGMLNFDDERCERVTTKVVGNKFDNPELLEERM